MSAASPERTGFHHHARNGTEGTGRMDFGLFVRKDRRSIWSMGMPQLVHQQIFNCYTALVVAIVMKQPQ